MQLLDTRRSKLSKQYLISIGFVLLVASVCFFCRTFIGYKVVALVMLMVVSILAMLFDILPVLISAVLSAVIWNYFFIPSTFTFHIDSAEDLLMFFLYFIIALVNAVLTFKIRNAENKARDKEEKGNTIKLYNTLLNSLSHELRTPISTIMGAVGTLQESKNELSAKNRNELLNQIDTASVRLNREVENLLNMSRLETGTLKLNRDWCDTNELINSVIQKTQKDNYHEIRFVENEQLPLLKFDRGLIEQVLQNLIQNAIQYTPQNSIITINALHQLESCIIIINDNGKGIPEEEMPFIFDKFYRLLHSKKAGSGLGLSIVKGFVDAHNGNVKVENNEFGGARFVIEFPAEASYINNLKNE